MKKIKSKNIGEFENIVFLIHEARNRAYSKVNEELVLLYFNVGNIVSSKVANGNWGEGTVDELADYISVKIPNLKGFNRRGLYRMKQFYETYSDSQFLSELSTELESYFTLIQTNTKVSSVPTQLSQTDSIEYKFISTILTKVSWTNHRLILSKTKTNAEKFYYLIKTINEKYSSRELERSIDTGQFERTMLSDTFVSAVRTQMPTSIFKDPYIFEFLDLPELHSESDLEQALIKNLQKFITELGKGFTYMGSQYRLQVGNKDYHTDLLFYHRDLQCLVLFELKIEEFQPEFLGKLNFYLEALDRDVKRQHENPSIGILLCKGKDSEVVEYAMARNTSPAMIADYETKLIDKKVLASKLHQLVEQLSRPQID